MKNRSGFTLPFIIFISVVALGVFIFFSWYKWQAEHNIGLETGGVTTSSTKQNTETPNNWKTYTFDEIGLTFMAPQDLDVTGELINKDSFTLYIQNNSSKVDTYYQLYVIAQWQNPYKDSDLENIKTELEPSSIESVTVAGYKGVRGQYKGQRNRFVTNFIKDGAMYSAATSQPTKENEALSNQILSTFKFTKDTVLLLNGKLNTVALEIESNWKTYVNSSIGIQFKYPILNISSSAGALMEQKDYPGVSLGEASFTVEKIPSMSAQSWYESKGKSRSNRVSQLNQTLVNGQSAYNLIVYSDPGDETIFLIEKGSNLYLIYSTLNNELLTKMLTTFEFIK